MSERPVPGAFSGEDFPPSPRDKAEPLSLRKSEVRAPQPPLFPLPPPQTQEAACQEDSKVINKTLDESEGSTQLKLGYFLAWPRPTTTVSAAPSVPAAVQALRQCVTLGACSSEGRPHVTEAGGPQHKLQETPELCDHVFKVNRRVALTDSTISYLLLFHGLRYGSGAL